MRARALAILAAASLACPALAQQVLYTPVAPKGSAYVRFVNGLDQPAMLSPDFLAAATLGAAGPDRVGAYAVVDKVAGKALAVTATAGARSGKASLTAQPGSFVTLLLRPEGVAGIAVVPVVDQTDFNQTKSHLAFYNATADCAGAGLKLAPSNAAVFADVAPGVAKARSVNPVTASVVASCGGADAAPVQLTGLEPGGMYSIWLMQPATGTKVSFISRDSTLPYKP